MLRMEIALFLLMAFVACMYFSADKERTALHRTFAVLLVTVLVHLVLDGVTVFTVNRLDAVPRLVNDAVHRLFLGSMVLVIYLFYQYIAILMEEETDRPRRLDWLARVFLAAAELCNFLLPISYTVTPEGNYSSGPYMLVPYCGVAFYLLLCAGLLAANWRQIDTKRKRAIGLALLIEVTDCALQGLRHTWLISGMGIALMTLSFYLTLENPRHPPRRADGAEDVHAVPQKSGESALSVQHARYHPHSGAAQRRQKGGRPAQASGGFLPAQRQGGQADGHAG